MNLEGEFALQEHSTNSRVNLQKTSVWKMLCLLTKVFTCFLHNFIARGQFYRRRCPQQLLENSKSLKFWKCSILHSIIYDCLHFAM